MTTTYQHNTRALSRQAREAIKARGWLNEQVTIAAYVRHWYPDGRWHGDSCGCIDDRCIGHHHDASDECHCLPVWLDVFMRDLVSGGTASASPTVPRREGGS